MSAGREGEKNLKRPASSPFIPSMTIPERREPGRRPGSCFDGYAQTHPDPSSLLVAIGGPIQGRCPRLPYRDATRTTEGLALTRPSLMHLAGVHQGVSSPSPASRRRPAQQERIRVFFRRPLAALRGRSTSLPGFLGPVSGLRYLVEHRTRVGVRTTESRLERE